MKERTIGVESAICVWDWENCPNEVKEYMREKNISPDDLDWIALVPRIYDNKWVNWLEEPIFGCFKVVRCPVGSLGYTLIAGYHS